MLDGRWAHKEWHHYDMDNPKRQNRIQSWLPIDTKVVSIDDIYWYLVFILSPRAVLLNLETLDISCFKCLMTGSLQLCGQSGCKVSVASAIWLRGVAVEWPRPGFSIFFGDFDRQNNQPASPAMASKPWRSMGEDIAYSCAGQFLRWNRCGFKDSTAARVTWAWIRPGLE